MIKGKAWIKERSEHGEGRRRDRKDPIYVLKKEEWTGFIILKEEKEERRNEGENTEVGGREGGDTLKCL